MRFDTFGYQCNNVYQSRRNGKLPLTRTTLRKNRQCSHRSNEKPSRKVAGVSCVGRFLAGCRFAAISSRWLSEGLALDRQYLTSTCTRQAPDKTGLRQPATRWAMRRKTCGASIWWATQIKCLSFGFTERAALCLVAIQDQHKQTERTHAEGHSEEMARHGGGVRLLAQSPFFESSTVEFFPLFLTPPGGTTP